MIVRRTKFSKQKSQHAIETERASNGSCLVHVITIVTAVIKINS